MGLLKRCIAVAIDGPAGSGKSTISKMVAERLGFPYIDTGAMYRALTFKVMRKNLDFMDEKGIIALSHDLDLKFIVAEKDNASVKVILENEDVSEEIRKLEVTGNVKHVAKIREVRENLVKFQRKMVENMSGAVMEGRDIGTVVLPQARFKFYVDASFDERVERRFAELKAKGHTSTRKEVEEDLKQRDHADRTRKVGPLRQAEDSVFIDTTDMSIDQVVSTIIQCIREA